MDLNLLKFTRVSSDEAQRRSRFTPTALALAVLPVAPVLLPAQSASAQVLEEVVVTARKREESMQEVPVAVNVMTADMITSQRIEGIKDLGTIVPGLVTTETAASTAGTIFLRGVGTGALNPFFDQAVAINIDGVGISSAQLMNAGMFDLERIEVMRGPQALFFGKNSPGGVIALHTKDPGQEFELELSALYETESEEPALRAVVSGPFSDTLAGRLSLGWSKSDGSVFDVYNVDAFEAGPGGVPLQTSFATDKNPVEIEKIYAMGTLIWEPTDSLSAKFKYAHVESDREGGTTLAFQRTQCGLGAPQTLYPVPGIDNCKMDDKVIGPGFNPALVAADPNFPNHQGNGFQDNENSFAVLEVNYDIGNDLTLTSVTGYFDNDEQRFADSSFQSAAGFLNSITFDMEQWSQELRLVSSFDGAVNFTLGAYYEEKEINQTNSVVGGSHFLNFYGFFPLPIGIVGDLPVPFGRQHNAQDGTAYSVFAQMDWDFADSWTLSAGARYSYEEKEGSVAYDVGGIPAFGVADTPLTNAPFIDNNPDWNNVSPELTVRYQFNDDVMFFASYRTGFKSGGFDTAYKVSTFQTLVAAGSAYDAIYNEEEAAGFEVGMKSTLLDGTLRLNVTAYSYDYDDLQLSKLATGADGVPALRVLNAAKADVDGLEVEAVWLAPVDGLTLTGNLALASSEYDEFIADCFTGQTVAMGCNVNLDPATGNFTGADMSGESLQNASDVSATFSVNYDVPVGSWNMGLNLTTSYKDDYNPTASLLPDDWKQDAYWLTNASVSLFSADDKWEFYIRGINLGNEFYSATGSDAPLSGNGALTGSNTAGGLGDFFQYINGGRQFTLGMTYRM